MGHQALVLQSPSFSWSSPSLFGALFHFPSPFAPTDSIHSLVVPTTSLQPRSSSTPCTPPGPALKECGALCSLFLPEAAEGWSSSFGVSLKALVFCQSVVWLHSGWAAKSNQRVEGGGWSRHTEHQYVACRGKRGSRQDGDSTGWGDVRPALPSYH